MPPLNRRSFLAGAAMLASAPTMASAQGAGDVDIVVIGAGAAGIAAARRVLAAKRSVVVIEASDRTRRALRHRHAAVRRSGRSRRALDSHAGHQSPGEARRNDRSRRLSRAARAEDTHRPTLRARERSRGLPLGAGAGQPGDQRRRARQDRHVLCAGAAERFGRMAQHRRVRAWTLQLRQGFERSLGGRLLQVVGARQGCVLPAGLRDAARHGLRTACRSGSRPR